MAHKKLKGSRRPKLSRTRKNVKVKKSAQKEGENNEDGKKDDRKDMMMKAKKNPAKHHKGPGGKQLNKKEARHHQTLEKMHRNLYHGNERILLVGEGNFSFAHALCRHLGTGAGIYATCLDTEADLNKKYKDGAEFKKKLEDLGGTFLTGVDATRLHKVKEFKGAFRKIIFNFPHIGGGESDIDKNIAQHRQLLAHFFASAVKCLEPEHDTSIHVSLKIGEPYKSWKVVQTAKAACPDLELGTVVPFIESAWPGYSHRRTQGFSDRFSNAASEELAKGAKVYVFTKAKYVSSDEES